MAEIAKLIERLEKATGPDQELDAALAREVWANISQECCGNFRHVVTDMDPRTGEPLGGHNVCCGEPVLVQHEPPPFTSSIDAALTLVPEGAESEITNLYGVARAVVGLNMDMPGDGEHKGGSLAVATCIAALRARAALAQGKRTDE